MCARGLATCFHKIAQVISLLVKILDASKCFLLHMAGSQAKRLRSLVDFLALLSFSTRACAASAPARLPTTCHILRKIESTMVGNYHESQVLVRPSLATFSSSLKCLCPKPNANHLRFPRPRRQRHADSALDGRLREAAAREARHASLGHSQLRPWSRRHWFHVWMFEFRYIQMSHNKIRSHLAEKCAMQMGTWRSSLALRWGHLGRGCEGRGQLQLPIQLQYNSNTGQQDPRSRPKMANEVNQSLRCSSMQLFSGNWSYGAWLPVGHHYDYTLQGKRSQRVQRRATCEDGEGVQRLDQTPRRYNHVTEVQSANVKKRVTVHNWTLWKNCAGSTAAWLHDTVLHILHADVSHAALMNSSWTRMSVCLFWNTHTKLNPKGSPRHSMKLRHTPTTSQELAKVCA